MQPVAATKTTLVTGSYPPAVCGVGDYTTCLARHLVRAVVWTRRAPGLAADACPVVEAFDEAGVRALCARIARERPRLLHLQYEAALYAPSIAGRLPAACRRAGVPLVTTFHSLDGPKAWGHSRRLALLPLLLGSDAVVVCAGRPFRALSRIPALAGKTHLIPVGSTVPATPRRGTAAAEAPGVPLRMAYFGFVWPGRGLETAVRALAAAHAAASPTGATLTLIGEVRDPAHAAELIHLARTLGVEGRVAFTGSLSAPEVSHHLADADVALLPYPTGVSTGRTTLMAALDHGLPVVTTSAPGGGLDARFRDGENMLLAPAGDADAFARETARAATDAGLRARLSAGASRLAREFSWERIAEEIARVYYGVGRGR